MSSCQVLHPRSMRPAREDDIPVRVKNSYNPSAPGTLIIKSRDMSKVCFISVISQTVCYSLMGSIGNLKKVQIS